MIHGLTGPVAGLDKRGAAKIYTTFIYLVENHRKWGVYHTGAHHYRCGDQSYPCRWIVSILAEVWTTWCDHQGLASEQVWDFGPISFTVQSCEITRIAYHTVIYSCAHPELFVAPACSYLLLLCSKDGFQLLSTNVPPEPYLLEDGLVEEFISREQESRLTLNIRTFNPFTPILWVSGIQ